MKEQKKLLLLQNEITEIRLQLQELSRKKKQTEKSLEKIEGLKEKLKEIL